MSPVSPAAVSPCPVSPRCVPGVSPASPSHPRTPKSHGHHAGGLRGGTGGPRGQWGDVGGHGDTDGTPTLGCCFGAPGRCFGVLPEPLPSPPRGVCAERGGSGATKGQFAEATTCPLITRKPPRASLVSGQRGGVTAGTPPVSPSRGHRRDPPSVTPAVSPPAPSSPSPPVTEDPTTSPPQCPPLHGGTSTVSPPGPSSSSSPLPEGPLVSPPRWHCHSVTSQGPPGPSSSSLVLPEGPPGVTSW